MRPRFEQLSALVHGVVQQRSRVGAEPRVQRHVVRSHENVNRVDLKETDAVYDATQRTNVDPPLGTGVSEALRGERDPPRLVDREVSRLGHRRSYYQASTNSGLLHSGRILSKLESTGSD